MYCRIKYDSEEKSFIFNYNNQDEIPDDIVYLEIYDSSIDEDSKVKIFNFDKFKDLIDLSIDLKLNNIDLSNNLNLERLYIKSFNLENLIISNDNKINSLELYNCDISSFNFLNILKQLSSLTFDRCNNNDKEIIFPTLDLEKLYIGDFYHLKKLKLNNLQNLKCLSLFNLIELTELYINKLKNLKELYIGDLNKLEILDFSESKLDILSFGNMNSLKYIDGYFKDHDLIMSDQPYNYYKQRVTQRRRIYNLQENDILYGRCGRCEHYISKENKINIRNSKIEYEDDEEILHNIKILSCC